MAGFGLVVSVSALLSSFGFAAGFGDGLEAVLRAGDGFATSEIKLYLIY